MGAVRWRFLPCRANASASARASTSASPPYTSDPASPRAPVEPRLGARSTVLRTPWPHQGPPWSFRCGAQSRAFATATAVPGLSPGLPRAHPRAPQSIPRRRSLSGAPVGRPLHPAVRSLWASQRYPYCFQYRAHTTLNCAGYGTPRPLPCAAQSTPESIAERIPRAILPLQGLHQKLPTARKS